MDIISVEFETISDFPNRTLYICMYVSLINTHSKLMLWQRKVVNTRLHYVLFLSYIIILLINGYNYYYIKIHIKI